MDVTVEKTYYVTQEFLDYLKNTAMNIDREASTWSYPNSLTDEIVLFEEVTKTHPMGINVPLPSVWKEWYVRYLEETAAYHKYLATQKKVGV